MVLRRLGDLFDWQGRVFLGEERWSFRAPFDKASLAHRISSRIAVVPPRRLVLPWLDTRCPDRVRGLLDGDASTLMPPRQGFPGSLFGLDMLFCFAGCLMEARDGSEVQGRYKVVPLFRWFLLLWLNGLMAVMALSLGTLIWAIAAGQVEYALRSLAIAFGSVLLMTLLHLIGRLVAWRNRPSREAFLTFFKDLTAA